MTSAHSTGEQRIPHPIGKLAGSALVVLGASAIATLFVSTETAGMIGAVAMMIGTAIAGYLYLSKLPLLPQDERRAWRLLGIGLLMISAGIAVLAYTVAATGYTSAFGPPDLLFLAGYGLGVTGLAVLPHTTGTRLQQARLFIDGIIGVIALTALFWVFFYSQITSALSESPAWERLVGSAYPLFDMMMLVTVMIVIVRRSTYRYDPRLVFIALGGVLQAAADIVFLLSGAGKTFGEADPLFPIHIIAIACFLAAASIVERPIESREFADRPATPLWAMALPYGTAGVMVAVLLIRVRWTSLTSADTVLLFATLAVGVMVVLRQGVAIRENRRFVEDQRTALVASISHELRTPLTAVVGFLDLLEAETLTDRAERLEVTSIASLQASYLSRIVADLVMLASDNVTPMDLDVTSTRVDEVAWSAVNTAAIDQSSIRVDVDSDVIAFLDRVRIEQAITNLLANAMRYGGDTVLVTAHADGVDLVIEVHDDGAGVPRKYELLIWEKFERGPNRLNATIPGSGIGLAVTSAIAKAHGGSAGYRRSERLGGACFWIRLPGRIQSSTPVRQRLELVEPDEAQTA